MGRLCNQKEIRHQLLTLAGCRESSLCFVFSFFSFLVLVLGVKRLIFFSPRFIGVFGSFVAESPPSRPLSFANALRGNTRAHTHRV